MNKQNPLHASALALLLLLPACSGNNGDSLSFVIRATQHATPSGMPPIVSGRWLVYFADEMNTTPGGQDLDGDMMADDVVPVVVDMTTGATTVTGVACDTVAVVGDQVYLVVDENVAGNQNGDGDSADLLLMHWSLAMGGPAVVDELDKTAPGELVAAVGARLYYVSAELTPLVAPETSLRYADADDPRTPVVVESGGAMPTTLRPRILGVDEGLLLLFLDETLETTENPMGLNQIDMVHTGMGTTAVDMDVSDSFVIALLDLTDPDAPLVLSTELALDSAATPFRARSTAADDWLVAFLVSESAQGVNDLNDPDLFDPAWKLAQCAATRDGDATDDVLFYIEYQDWLAGTPPVNTGLVGRDRVLAVDGYVATIVDEADAGCFLNSDGDDAESFLRWTAVGLPVIPPDATTQLVALANLPDDSFGVATLSNRFVCAVSELADGNVWNGDAAMDDDLLAWIDPTVDTSWTFLHDDPDPGQPDLYVGVEWMAPDERFGRLAAAFQEEVYGSTINTTCSGLYDDGDATDSVPVWLRFFGGCLIVPGSGFALEMGNPGIVLTGTHAYFRVNEMDQGQMFNGDMDATDPILFRNSLTACSPVAMGTASSEAGDVLVTDGVVGAAYVADEMAAGVEFDMDGDAVPDDLVVLYFLF